MVFETSFSSSPSASRTADVVCHRWISWPLRSNALPLLVGSVLTRHTVTSGMLYPKYGLSKVLIGGSGTLLLITPTVVRIPRNLTLQPNRCQASSPRPDNSSVTRKPPDSTLQLHQASFPLVTLTQQSLPHPSARQTLSLRVALHSLQNFAPMAHPAMSSPSSSPPSSAKGINVEDHGTGDVCLESVLRLIGRPCCHAVRLPSTAERQNLIERLGDTQIRLLLVYIRCAVV